MFRLFSYSHLQAVTQQVVYIQLTTSQKMRDLVYMVIATFIYLARQPPPPPLPVGHGLLIHEVSRSHSTTHHIR